jgi:hypothetical protein
MRWPRGFLVEPAGLGCAFAAQWVLGVESVPGAGARARWAWDSCGLAGWLRVSPERLSGEWWLMSLASDRTDESKHVLEHVRGRRAIR